MKTALVTILIPIYLEEPTELEKISLTQTLTVLNKYPITFMTPEGLDTSWYENFCQGKATIYFERFKWKGIEQFGVLQSTPAFYERFLKYEYMLICHLDSFVFRDEVEKWCSLGYDFIGSVIYNTKFQIKDTFLRKLTTFTNPEYFGSAGFGLKKVKSYYYMTSRFKLYIDFYHFQRKLRKRAFYDDLFYTQHFPKLSSKFKISPKHLAEKFGADFNIFEKDKLPFNQEIESSLPFGVHGWIQYNQDYWKPCIRRHGYSIK